MSYAEALDRLKNLRSPQGRGARSAKSPLLALLALPSGALPEKTGGGGDLGEPPGGHPQKGQKPPKAGTPAPRLAGEAPEIGPRPRCERGEPCDLDGTAAFCRDYCRPGAARQAEAEKTLADLRLCAAPAADWQGPEPRGCPPGRPAWREEVATWPEDFRADFDLMVESYTRHGDPRGIAEYKAFLDLVDGLPNQKGDR